MSEFSKAEHLFAKYLSRFPLIKSWIKICYQSIVFMFYRKPAKMYLQESVKVIPVLKSPQLITFGGYYDKNLIIDNRVLFHQMDVKMANLWNKPLSISIGGVEISISNSWNWQQGAMLSWISENQIIYNDFRAGKYVAVIKNVTTAEEKIINKPVYTISEDKAFALSLNFKRLAKYRPDYGYFNLSFNELENDQDDGIFKINLDTGQFDLIISIERLINFKPRVEMTEAAHKVNHIMISPNSKRFMFLHRWYTKTGVKYSRLYTSDNQGKELYLLADNQMVSHCNWKNNHEIIGWLRKKEGNHYYCLTDQTTKYSIIAGSTLNEDGHPSISRDQRWLLTDTYPDKSRMAHVLLYDLVEEKKIELGSFFSPLKYRGTKRCDLHPRFSDDEKSISFDSTHENKRGMYIMDISKVIAEHGK